MAIDPKSLVSGIDLMPDEQIQLQRIRLAQQSDQFAQQQAMQEKNRQELIKQREQELEMQQLDQLRSLLKVDWTRVTGEKDRNEILREMESLEPYAAKVWMGSESVKKTGKLTNSEWLDILKQQQKVENLVNVAEENAKKFSTLGTMINASKTIDKNKAYLQLQQIQKEAATDDIRTIRKKLDDFAANMPVREPTYNRQQKYKDRMLIPAVNKGEKYVSFDKTATLDNINRFLSTSAGQADYEAFKDDYELIHKGAVLPDNMMQTLYREEALAGEEEWANKQLGARGGGISLSYSPNSPDAENIPGTPYVDPKTGKTGTEYNISGKLPPYVGNVPGFDEPTKGSEISKFRMFDDGTYEREIVYEYEEEIGRGKTRKI